MGEAAPEKRHEWWMRVALRLAKSTLFLILLVVSVACIYFGFRFERYPALSSTLLGIGGSLFASLAFALLYSWIVEYLILNQVSDQIGHRLDANELAIKQQIESTLGQLKHSIHAATESAAETHHGAVLASLPAFVPRMIYPVKLASDPNYVNHVVRNMRDGSTYTFRGVTGRHVASFISMARPSHLACTIILLDPRNTNLLTSYVKERFELWHEQEERFEAKIQQVKGEIFSSIVSIFDISKIIPVHLKLHQGPVYFRSEVFDEEAFLSIYAGNMSTPYPWTCVFGKDSYIYQFLRMDLQECIAIQGLEITFSAASSEKDLAQFLRIIGGDESVIPEYRSAARQFRGSVETSVRSDQAS